MVPWGLTPRALSRKWTDSFLSFFSSTVICRCSSISELSLSSLAAPCSPLESSDADLTPEMAATISVFVPVRFPSITCRTTQLV